VDHVVHRTADGLARRGHEVDVVCLRADRSYEAGAYRVRVLDVPLAPIETLEERVLARSGVVLQRPYDVFVVAMYPFFRVASVLGLPFVYWEFGVVDPVGLSDTMRRLLARIRRQGQAYQLRARRVASISRFLMHEQVNPARWDETDLTYLGAESYGPPPPPADVAAFRAVLGLEPDAEVIGCVGRIERNSYKGVDDLVAIADEVRARRPRARLLLVGHADGAARGYFGALPGVLVHANVPDTQMPLFFAAMDVVVSGSRWEGFNLGLAEGQFYGRPVVAYRCGAHPEIVAPAGELVRSRAEFVRAVVALLADPVARRRRGEESRRFAERFTWANTVEGMAACLRHAGVPEAAPCDVLADLAAAGLDPGRGTAVTLACGAPAEAAALGGRFERVVAVERGGWAARPPAPRVERARSPRAHLDCLGTARADLVVAGGPQAPLAGDDAVRVLREGVRVLAWGGVLVLRVAPGAVPAPVVAELASANGARLATVHRGAAADAYCVVRDGRRAA
jgi:glycosyltransferase involved in cell wall biosynthesis